MLGAGTGTHLQRLCVNQNGRSPQAQPKMHLAVTDDKLSDDDSDLKLKYGSSSESDEEDSTKRRERRSTPQRLSGPYIFVVPKRYYSLYTF